MRSIQLILLAAVIWIVGFWFASAWPSASHAGETVPADATGRIVYAAGRLSVDVTNMQLRDILAILARQAKFDLTIRGDRDALVSDSFAGLPLNDGLRRLLGDYDWIASHAAGGGGAFTDVIVMLKHAGTPVRDTAPTRQATARAGANIQRQTVGSGSPDLDARAREARELGARAREATSVSFPGLQ